MKETKKNNTKLIVTIAVAIIFVIQLCVPFLIIESNADSTATVVQRWNISATTNDNVTATLYSNGELVISGTGRMKDGMSFSSYKSKIKTIMINEGVTNIGINAFDNCNSLTRIEIPASIKGIGYGFWGCSILESINVNNNNQYYTSENGVLFNKLKTTIIQYPAGKENTTYNIPEGVINIDGGAFNGCRSLTSIEIPDGVTSIGASAFRGCNSLTSIEIPKSVRNIGVFAFYECRNLTSIEIPEGITTIQAGTFLYCSKLEDVKIPNSVRNIEGRLYNEGAFSGCSSLTSIEIPSSVTSIGTSAFSNCSSLTSIAIPNSVTSIGASAFSNCSSLTSITIPNSVTSIEGAFSGCSSLTSIEIPESVTSIEGAFYGCSSLTSITVNTNNRNYASEEGILFNKEKTLLIQYPRGNERKTYNIPEGTTSIRSGAFSGCNSLTSIEIPESVTSIGTSVFSNCSSLTSIAIPNSVTSIGRMLFVDCSSLTRIEIPSSVIGIESEAFYNCSSLTSIEIPNSVKRIEYGAFTKCSSLTSIEIPNSVTNIGANAFKDCSNLTRLKIATNAVISDDMFSGCNSLTDLIISEEITNMNIALFRKYNLANITVDENNLNYASEEGVLFNKEKTLLIQYPRGNEKKTYNIPKGVTNIEKEAFWNCSSLTSIEMPGSVTSIGEWAFSNCNNLTSIKISESLTNIEVAVFYNCSSLTSIEIPNSLTSIGDSAFSSCSSLTSIEIPNSVTSIGNFTFNGCSSLTSIEIPSSVTSIENGTFSGCSSLTSIEISRSVISIGEWTFSNCNRLTSIEIPSSVASIGNYAFNGCSRLKIYCNPNSTTESYAKTNNISYDSTGPLVTLDKNGNNNCYVKKETILVTVEEKEVLGTNEDELYYAISESKTETPEFTNKFTSGEPIKLEEQEGTYYLWIKAETEKLENETAFCSNAFYLDNTLEEGAMKWDISATTEDNVKATLYTDGKLVISGTGNMKNWTSSRKSTDFRNYMDQINKMEIEEGITNIGNYAFSGCSNLTSIEIPNSVTSTGSNAFYGCTNLTSITMPGNIDIRYFDYFKITNIIIQEGSTNIGDFSYCTALTSIKIPESVTSIGVGTFEGCTSLTSIKIPESVTNIREDTFNGCSSLTSIEIPESVTNIGEYAFAGCTGLTSITLPEGVTSIESGAFSECSSLKSIEIPSNVTSIGDATFYGCNSLTRIEIPNSVIGIESEAFYNCSSLTSIEIPNSVKRIEYGAFTKCSSLTSITIPATVTSIGYSAFSNCSNLTIYCNPNSAAETYAKDNNIVYDSTGPRVILDKNGNSKYSKSETLEVTVAEKEVLGTNEDELYYAISNSNEETPEFTNKFVLGDTIKLEDLTGTYYLWVKATTEKLGNETAFCSNAFYLDSAIPQAVIITGQTEEGEYTGKYTNKEVTISMEKGAESLSGISRIEYTVDDGENGITYDENNKPKVTNEGTTRIKARAINGVETVGESGEEYIVKIDKTLPEVTIEISNNEEASKTKQMKILATDNTEKLNLGNEYKYCITTTEELTGTEEWLDYTIGEEYKIGDNLTGEYYIHIKPIKDEAGNESSVVKSDKMEFDNKAPEVVVQYMKRKLEKEIVVAIVTADENLEKVDGWYYLLNDKTTIIKVYEENKEEEIELSDKLGNKTTKAIKVDSIAKEPEPTGEFKYTKQTEGERNYILEVSPETTLENFRINIGNLKNAQVKIEEGTELTTGQYVGTGMTVEIEGTKYIIVVKGDSYKGDGIVNTFDLLAMFYHKVYSANEEENEYKLSEEKLKAADINENGEVDSIDLLKVFYHKEAIDNYKL